MYPPGQRWLTKELIVGRVVGYLPKVGYVKKILKKNSKKELIVGRVVGYLPKVGYVCMYVCTNVLLMCS